MKKVSDQFKATMDDITSEMESGELDVKNAQLVTQGAIAAILIVILGHLEEMNDSEEREES